MVAVNASPNEQRYIEKLKRARIPIGTEMVRVGSLHITDVKPMHIAAAANSLYPRAKNNTKNRQVYTPAASILHFAHDNDLRDYIVIKKLESEKTARRRPAEGVPATLLSSTEGHEHAFLSFLFHQGWRVTEALSLWRRPPETDDEWSRCKAYVDIRRSKLVVYVSKSNWWKEIWLHETTKRIIKSLPDEGGEKLFPWRDRHAVYRWLRPLCKDLGVYFTPHMARHDFATDLKTQNVPNRGIADASTWTSERSVGLYTDDGGENAKNVLALRKIETKTRVKTRGKKASA